MDKPIHRIKWTKLQSDIFRFLCIRAGQSLNLRGLAKALRVSPTAVSKSIVELEKEKFVKIIRSKTMNLFSIAFNRDNHKALEMKRVENLKMLYESGLSDALFDAFPGCAIVLFGSYSRGEDVWTISDDDETISDIDIA